MARTSLQAVVSHTGVTLVKVSMLEPRGRQVTDKIPASLLSVHSLSTGVVGCNEVKGRRMYNRNKDVQLVTNMKGPKYKAEIVTLHV